MGIDIEEKVKLLVVEDDESHAELLRRGLENHENLIFEFSDTLSDAGNKLSLFKPDIVLTDWRLPDGEGIELIRKNSSGEVIFPVVLMTSFGNENLAVDAIKNGAMDYIVKSSDTLGSIGRIINRTLREWNLVLEKRTMSKTLAENEFRYRAVSQMMTDYVFSAEINENNSFHIDWRYGRLENLYGYSIEEIESGNDEFLFAIHPDDFERVRRKFPEVLKNNEVNVEYRIIHKNGEIKWVNHFIKPVWDDNLGRVIRFIAAVQDITSKKKSEADKLRLHNLESIGVLAGGIAHDFNNILGSIMGRIGLALMGLPDGKLRNHLLSVEKAVTRAVSLTRQLLTFAKGGTPEKCVISLKRIIQDTAKFSLSGSSVDVKFDLQDTQNVEADPGQISQVIQNLVINAKQAMPLGGIINISTIDVEIDGIVYVKISVQDNGVGIPKEYLSKIFDPYFTTKESGSGLGLSVCYSIILKHDGRISVVSEKGKGTTFEILIPSSEKREEQKRPEKVAAAKQRYKILVMDDDPEIRELYSDMLEAMEHDVTLTKDGEECIKEYLDNLDKNKKFNFILMDLTVKGGMGGVETSQKIKEIDPNVKIIICSGYSDKGMGDFNNVVFSAKLNKPFSVEELSRVINDIMR